jgi:large subunit ribosomal protein L10
VPTEAKAASVLALRERLGTCKAAVLTEYRGLTVRQLSDLRKQLKAASAEYKVVKNRLARLAVKDSALDPLAGHLKGPTGLVIAREDPVSVAKALQAFVRTTPIVAIKGGMVEGKVLGPPELRALADLPSKEALRAQVVGAIQGPLSQLITLLTAPQAELVRVLEARSKGSNTEERQEAI